VIKILTTKSIAPFTLELSFSNGETGVFDATSYLAEKSGSLLTPLKTADYFERCFVDAGALCWPNGLELSGQRVFELSKVLETH
jgi:Protein of unknown function (DUF2442)